MGKRKKRKPRVGEVVCRCGAYPFPHRQFGGRCASDVADVTWANHQSDVCRDCRLFDRERYECQYLSGLETMHEAECITEHVRYHEIKLYGVNRPPDHRGKYTNQRR